jgi:hypothetical protein
MSGLNVLSLVLFIIDPYNKNRKELHGFFEERRSVTLWARGFLRK